MKATNYIIIGGGALALLLLFKNKQKTKASTSSTTTGGTTTGGTTTGGTTIGGNATAGTSQVTSFPTPTSNEPEQVFGLGLPTGMDLPILTAGTGIPTEVAVQQGGVSTMPTPAITPPPPLGIEEGLQPLRIYPTDAPRPYRPIIPLPADTTPWVMPRPYDDYPPIIPLPADTTPWVMPRQERDYIVGAYNTQTSNMEDWIIPRANTSTNVRPYNPKDYQFLI